MRFNVSKGLCLLAVTALVACGQDNQNEKQNDRASAPVVAPAASTAPKTAPDALPAMIVTKVRVGADGQETVDGMESRLLTKGATLTGADQAAQIFAQGSQVTIANELDSDTSSQQWWGEGYYYWGTPWYPGKALGRGVLWGHNPYVYYGGYSYGYNYYNSYNYNGCNYYYWNRY
jgi:hypothetical protein